MVLPADGEGDSYGSVDQLWRTYYVGFILSRIQ